MEIVKRKSSRAILLTPNHEVLLIKIANPKGNWIGWIAPGGGIDEGETELAALKRELKEELGFEFKEIPQKVWQRFHIFPWNDKIVEQNEVFWLIETERFAPAPDAALTESEMLEFKEMRWWTVQELAQSGEEFAPRNFYQQLKKLITGTIPSLPIDVGI